MAILTSRPTLTTTAAALWAENSTGRSEGVPMRVTIQNGATQTVCIGNAATTTTVYGHLLAINAAITLTVEAGEKLYACSSASTQQVNVLVSGY